MLGHLGSGAEIGTATLDAALAGRDGPGSDFNQPVWDRWNGLDNQAKAAGFLEHGENLVARYEALDAATRADLRIKLPFFPEPVDVATIARLRTSEITYHGWDVRVAFDPAATLHPAAVDLMIDHSGDFLAYLGKADRFRGTTRHHRHRDDRPVTVVHPHHRRRGLAWPTATPPAGRRRRHPPPPGRVVAPPHSSAACRPSAPPPTSPSPATSTLDDLRPVFPGV